MKTAFLTAFIFVTICVGIAYAEIIPGMVREKIFQYYFLDYLGVFFVLIAQKLLQTKDKRAFIFYVVGLAINGFFGYLVGSYSLIIFSAYSGVIFIHNWHVWKKDEEKASHT